MDSSFFFHLEIGRIMPQTIKDLIEFGEDGYGDLHPLWSDRQVFARCLDSLLEIVDSLKSNGMGIDRIVGIDSKGYIIGSALADRLELPFSPIFKAGKLPGDLEQVSEQFTDYSGEKKELSTRPRYFEREENILLVDDWIETGAQLTAATKLLEQCKTRVVAACVIINDTGREELFVEDHPFTRVYYLEALERK